MNNTAATIRVQGNLGVAKARHVGGTEWVVTCPHPGTRPGLRRFRLTGSRSQIQSALYTITFNA